MKQLFYLTLLILFPMISYSQTLVSVTPGSVNAGETLDVTITGSSTHFTDPNGTELYFGFASGSSTSQDCINSMTVVDDVTLSANITVPSYVGGSYNVQVINSIDGTIPPGHITVIANQAHLTGITPNNAVAGQTLDVTITGANTHFTTNSNDVVFGISQGSGTINVNSVSVIDDQTLSANISVSANTYTGTYNVHVDNVQDDYMYYNGFSISGYTPAHIISVNPHTGAAGQTLNLLIATSGTSAFTQTTNTINIGYNNGFVVNSIDIYNDSLLLANVTIPEEVYTMYYDIVIINSLNGEIIGGDPLFVIGPTPPGDPYITISPDSGNAGQTLEVTITGTGTSFTQASATASSVFLSSPELSNNEVIYGTFNIVDNTTMIATFTIPAGHMTTDMDFTASMTSDPYLTVYAGFHINGIDPLFGFVIPTPESDEGACDGSSQIVVSGGTAPYSYNVNGTTTGQATTTDLCEGLYDATVTDANGEELHMSFVIVPPNGVYTTQTYVDSIMNDTIYNNVITNCTVDFNTIDEIYIETVAQLGGNEIVVTWHVGYGAGQFVNITDIYNLSDFAGVYTLALELFCPNKSLSSYLMAFDQIYYEQGVAGLNDQDAFSEMVVYPNPFSGTISIALNQEQETMITLMDLTGKVVLTTSSSDRLTQISTDQLASGQYMLVLQSDASIATRKVVKL